MTTNRLEAFGDDVSAIIIMLMAEFIKTRLRI